MSHEPVRHELALRLLASICLVFLLFSCVGCGGGGGAGSPGEPPPPPVVPQARGEAWFAYYGDEDGQLEATRGHASMVWTSGWLDPQGRAQDVVMLERAAAACAAGKRVMLMMPADSVYIGGRYNPAAGPILRGILAGLGPTGRACVAGVFPVDEPDAQGISHTELLRGNQELRLVLWEFPETIRAKLAVIYAGANDFPGLPSYDWVGFDDYYAGDNVLGGPLAGLLDVLRPDQRAFLVPGGADPWRQDPAPFVAKLLEDPRIIGMVVFIRINNPARGVGLGTKSNGMGPAYCAAAVAISGGSCP